METETDPTFGPNSAWTTLTTRDAVAHDGPVITFQYHSRIRQMRAAVGYGIVVKHYDVPVEPHAAVLEV